MQMSMTTRTLFGTILAAILLGGAAISPLHAAGGDPAPLTGKALIRARAEHTAGGQRICTDRHDGVGIGNSGFSQAFYDLRAKATALTVNNQNSHIDHSG
jgi:hypothetical protein